MEKKWSFVARRIRRRKTSKTDGAERGFWESRMLHAGFLLDELWYKSLKSNMDDSIIRPLIGKGLKDICGFCLFLRDITVPIVSQARHSRIGTRSLFSELQQISGVESSLCGLGLCYQGQLRSGNILRLSLFLKQNLTSEKTPAVKFRSGESLHTYHFYIDF